MMTIPRNFVSMLPALLLLSLSFATTTTTTTSALPEQVFWDNTDWPSDLTPIAGNDDLLEGTVLFAQSQVIPSKHGIENDNQPHLTALRKTLVMFRPHSIEDESVNMEFTVRDKDGTVLSGRNPIAMNDPEDIPKQDGWIELGKIDNIEFPSSLDGAYVVQGQSNLDNIIGSDIDNANLANIFNTQNNKVEIKTWDGSWIEEVFLPNGSQIPEGSKFQVSCGSSWEVKVHYPKAALSGNDGSDWRTKTVSTNEKLVIVLVNNIWVSKNDPKPDYVPEFPSSLDNPYIVEYQQNLDEIGNDPEAVALTNILNDNDKTPSNEIEIKTSDGSWVKNIYFPEGSTVPANSKIQITCDSQYDANVHYSNAQTGGWRTRSLSQGQVLIFVLTPNNNVWLASDDLQHNDYVFGHTFYTATLNAEWVEPGTTLEFVAASGERGVLDEIDIG